MATLSIKAKVSGATVLCLVGAGVCLVALLERSYQRNVDMLAQQSFDMPMANPDLRQVFAARDRPKLIEATTPLFQRLRTRYGVTSSITSTRKRSAS